MIPPYMQQDPGYHGDRSRGAGMGRPTHAITPGAKVRLRAVPAVDGDYDPGGAYWGSVGGHVVWWENPGIGVDARVWGPKPLWCAWDDFGGVQWIRAASREEAKRELMLRVGEVRFYR